MDFSRHGNQLKYKINYDMFLEHANKNHWIYETDVFIAPKTPKVEKSVFTKIKLKDVKPKIEELEIIQPKKKPLNIMDDIIMKIKTLYIKCSQQLK